MVSWKWVASVGTATAGIIAAPVADSLLKEKKLPDGIGAIASTLWDWLTLQVSLPLWFTVLLVLFMWLGLKVLLRVRACTANIASPTTAKLNQDLQKLALDKSALKVNSDQLQAQLDMMRESRESQQSKNAALEIEIATQKSANSELKQQLAAKPQAPKKVEVELPAFASKVLSIIAKFADMRTEPSLIQISSSGSGQVEAEGALDILYEHQMVKKAVSGSREVYSLTAKGRAHYLKQKEEEKG